MFLSLDILDRGQSGIPEVITKCIVRHDISPEYLGFRNSRKKIPCKTTDNEEDRPEDDAEDEATPDQLLQGL